MQHGEMLGPEDIKAISPIPTFPLVSLSVLEDRLLWTLRFSRDCLFLLVITEKDQMLPFRSLLALISLKETLYLPPLGWSSGKAQLFLTFLLSQGSCPMACYCLFAWWVEKKRRLLPVLGAGFCSNSLAIL